jgi:hypothetical protein
MKKTLLTGILALGMVIAAQAIPITGSIDMSGTANNLNNTLLGSATSVAFFTGVTVGGSPTGAFTGTLGSSVTWSGFSWPSNVLVAPLWHFMSVAGTTYSFDLANVSVFSQSNSFLNLMGSGTLHVDGFDDTPGTWSFTISNPGGGAHANFDFTFANSQTAAGVPDGGMTVALLGIAFVGLEGFRRKLGARKG